MNKTINLVVSVFFTILLLIYVYPESPDFPKQLPDSVQSFEPADVETELRRGYYTNLTRGEVIEHYKKEFNKGFTIFTPRLNYPPEEAQTIIRDQTKSTFLEEIVHPFRESIYINGFEPKEKQYAQFYEGIEYRQKVIVRYIPTSQSLRISLSLATGLVLYLILESIRKLKK
jgi:hypothetical protein